MLLQRRFVASPRMIISLVSILSLVAMVLVIFGVTHDTKKAKADANGSYSFKQLGFGGGGFVTGMAIHPMTPGVVYARTDVGGAYRLDANDTWTQLIVASAIPNPTQTDYNVESIAISPKNDQVVYVAAGSDYNTTTSTGRILKSTDRGHTFTDSGQRWFMSGGGDYRTGNERLVVDPQNDNIVYYASRFQGLWVSTDAGQQWNQVSISQIPLGITTGSAPPGVDFVVFDPKSGLTNGATSRIYAGVSGAGIYISNDAGGSWTQSYTTTQIPYTADIGADDTFYMGGLSTLERYIPATNTWKDISPDTEGTFIVAADPFTPQRVIVTAVAVRNGHIWRSTDSGDSWTPLQIAVSSPTIPWAANSDEVNYMSTGKLTFDPLVKDKLWFPEGIGMWYSSDNTGSTITWNFYSKGIEETVASDIVAPPGGAPVTTIYDRQGAYHANVDGYPANTLVDNTFWGGTSLDYSGNSPNFLVTAQVKNNTSTPYGRGASSSDGGKTWNVFAGTPADSQGGNIAVAASDTNDIVWLPSTGNFAQGKVPYYSLDGGKTWNQSTGLNSTKTHWFFYWGGKRAMTADKVADHTFYAITFDNVGVFYTSTDGGKTWTQAANSPTCTQNDNCHVYGQIHATPGHAGHVWSSAGTDGLWYTTDAGASAWTKVTGVQEAGAFGFGAPLAGYSYPAVYLYGKANSDTSYGLYRSADQGATWLRISDAPLGIYDNEYVVSGDMNIPGRVYVGFTGNGFAYGDSSSTAGGPTPTSAPAPKVDGVITRTNDPITIDGSGSEAVWNTTPSYTLGNTLGSPQQFSGSFQLAWDDTNLYVLAKTTDPNYATSNSDVVEVYVDANNAKSTTYNSSTDWQLQVLAKDGSALVWQNGTKVTPATKPTVALSKKSGSYTTEIAYPWSSLGATPKTNGYVGIEVHMAQYDTAGNRLGTLLWHGTTDDAWHDPSTFGTAQLVGNGSQPNPTATTSTAPTATTNTAPTATATTSGGNAWQSQDIGAVGLAGTTTITNGTFAIAGAGDHIGASADSFRFVDQPLNGDGTIIARVQNMNEANGYAFGGLMMRESLDPAATFATVGVVPINQSIFQARTTTGTDATWQPGGGTALPYWVKLVRAGTTFTGSVSSDGTNWTVVNTATINMNAQAYVGLAVVSRNTTVLEQVTFDHVSVQTP